MPDEEPKSLISKERLIGLLIVAILSPFYFIFSQGGKEGLGFIFVSITGVFAAVIYVKRRFLSNLIYMASLALIYVLHLIIIFSVHIPSRFPGFIMLPISILDLIFIMAIMFFLEKSVLKSTD